jgi:hypothetical protein
MQAKLKPALFVKGVGKDVQRSMNAAHNSDHFGECQECGGKL